MPKNRNIAKIILIVSSLLLVVIFLLVILEKNNVTKFFTNEKLAVQTADPRPVNDVSYSPATTSEQVEGDALKKELIEKSNSKTEKSPINVTIAFAGQETTGGPLVIEAFVNGVISGNCNFKIVNTQTSKEYSSNIISTGGAYACSRITIPSSDLSGGTYRVVITVNSGDLSGSAEQQVEVST
jgi:hypothetical protein